VSGITITCGIARILHGLLLGFSSLTSSNIKHSCDLVFSFGYSGRRDVLLLLMKKLLVEHLRWTSMKLQGSKFEPSLSLSATFAFFTSLCAVCPFHKNILGIKQYRKVKYVWKKKGVSDEKNSCVFGFSFF